MLLGSNKCLLLLLLSEQGLLLCLLLRVLLCLVLRLEVRRHRDGRQGRTRTPRPHFDGAGPGVEEAGPRAPSSRLLGSSVLLLCAAGRRPGALS
jgi:hypothetical protein